MGDVHEFPVKKTDIEALFSSMIEEGCDQAITIGLSKDGPSFGIAGFDNLIEVLYLLEEFRDMVKIVMREGE